MLFRSGRPTPAVGFAIGIERVLAKLQENKITPTPAPDFDIYVAQLGVEARKKALKLFEELRQDGLQVTENMSKKGLKDQLDIADKRGTKYTLILGQKEISDGTVLIRDMENGVQEIVDYNKIKNEIRKRLEHKVMKNSKLKKIS